MNKCEFVASEADHRALVGSYRLLTFAYFKLFMGLKFSAGPHWSKKVCETNELGLCIENLQKLANSLYGGFEFEAVGGCTKPTKKRKNAETKETLLPDNYRARKDALASAKTAHTVNYFWRK